MKSKILVYQGGGYEGCIWEWNVCMWDEYGTWYDIVSSGHSGISTEVGAVDFIKEKNIEKLPFEEPTKFSLLNLKSQKEMNFFRDEYTSELVLQVLQFLGEEVPGNYRLELKCGECGNTSPCCDDFIHTSYKGIGGIAIQQTNLMCMDCYNALSCSICGQLPVDETFSYTEGLPHDLEYTLNDYVGQCEVCAPESVEQDLYKTIDNVEIVLKEGDFPKALKLKKEVELLEIALEIVEGFFDDDIEFEEFIKEFSKKEIKESPNQLKFEI